MVGAPAHWEEAGVDDGLRAFVAELYRGMAINVVDGQSLEEAGRKFQEGLGIARDVHAAARKILEETEKGQLLKAGDVAG
jgi:hypothetical protein